MYIGYNISKANESMDAINSAYKDVAKKVGTLWKDVQGTLRGEWIGPDEQDFEKKIMERIEKMLASSKALTENAINVLYELAIAWAKFQDSNTISGQSMGTFKTLTASLKKPTVAAAPELSFTAIKFDNTTTFGLTSSRSDNAISDALDTFAKSIKRESENLFKSIDMSAAFYGNDQAKKLKKLMEEVGEGVGIISTSLKDFKEAMKQLTTKTYKSADDAVADQLKEAANTVKSSLNELGDTRWK